MIPIAAFLGRVGLGAVGWGVARKGEGGLVRTTEGRRAFQGCFRSQVVQEEADEGIHRRSSPVGCWLRIQHSSADPLQSTLRIQRTMIWNQIVLGGDPCVGHGALQWGCLQDGEREEGELQTTRLKAGF